MTVRGIFYEMTKNRNFPRTDYRLRDRNVLSIDRVIRRRLRFLFLSWPNSSWSQILIIIEINVPLNLDTNKK